MTSYLRGRRRPPSESYSEASGQLLRRVDWRFLLGREHFEAALCDADTELSAAVRAVCSRVFDIDTAPGGLGLAVLGRPTDATLGTAFSVLAPGGACYVEVRRPAPAGMERVRRRMERAGFRDVDCYWIWPPGPRSSPLFWLPLQGAGAISYFLRTRQHREGLWRWLGNRILMLLWQAAKCCGLLAPFCAIGRKPNTGGQEDSALPGQLARKWQALGLGEVPTAVTCLMLTGGRSRLNKVVMLAFANDDSDPSLALKFARVAESELALEREVSALRAVSDTGVRSKADIPTVMFHQTLGAVRAVGESPVEGRPILESLTRERYEKTALDVTDVLITLGHGTEHLPRTSWWDRLVEPVLNDFSERFSHVLDTSGVDEIRNRLDGAPFLPLVPEHRDCSPWNIVVTEKGRLGLLDWESAEPLGLPLLDLVYFLTNASLLVDGTLGSGRELATYNEMLSPSTCLGGVYNKAMLRYGQSLDLDPSVFAPLRTFAWMIHAQSQKASLGRGRGQLGQPSHSNLYLALWQRDVERL